MGEGGRRSSGVDADVSFNHSKGLIETGHLQFCSSWFVNGLKLQLLEMGHLYLFSGQNDAWIFARKSLCLSAGELLYNEFINTTTYKPF